MIRISTKAILPSVLSVASVLGIAQACSAQDGTAPGGEGAKSAVAKLVPSKAATTQPTNNNVTGTVTLTQQPDGKVKVVANVSGLTPGSEHGFHIHETPDMSAPDLMSTGGHFNPTQHAHGGPTTSPVHAGDFGNLKADAKGNAMLELVVDGITIGGPHNVIGLPVIVHAKPDDLKSQPAGNSGARVAGGLIEAAK